MKTVDEILKLYQQRGGSGYGGEAVTQLEHALQAAMFAERDGAGALLIAAALLHDLGHIIHSLPDDAPNQGIDDRHEATASNYLAGLFPVEVLEPIKMHVDAKRYLCATEPAYLNLLSEPSLVSLALQGGPMSADEVDTFQRNPHCDAAVRLRRWDDEAKIAGFETPPLEHFESYLRAAAFTQENSY